MPLGVESAGMRINPAALRAIRERTGLSSAALADKAGVRREVLSRLEGGDRPGTPEQIVALAKALNVPVTAIIKEAA